MPIHCLESIIIWHTHYCIVFLFFLRSSAAAAAVSAKAHCLSPSRQKLRSKTDIVMIVLGDALEYVQHRNAAVAHLYYSIDFIKY